MNVSTHASSFFRALTAVLGVALALGLMGASPAAAQTTIEFNTDDQGVQPGETFTVPVTVDNLDQISSDNDFANFDFDIDFSGVNATLENVSFNNTLTEDAGLLTSDDIRSGDASVSAAGTTPLEDFASGGSGVIARLEFTAGGTEGSGTVDLRNFNVTSPLQVGDANADFDVSVAANEVALENVTVNRTGGSEQTVVVDVTTTDLDGLDIQSFDLGVDFNSSVLTPADNPIIRNGNASNFSFTDDVSGGTLSISSVTGTPGTALSGDGLLFQIEFNVEQTGTSDLAFSNVAFRDGSNNVEDFAGVSGGVIVNSDQAPAFDTPVSSPQSTPEDETASFDFTVTDSETANENLELSASSSNETVVPVENINLTGPDATGASTIEVTPALNEFGNSDITITATDGAENTATNTFTLNVTPVDDPPTAVDDEYPRTDGDVNVPADRVQEDEELSVDASNGLLANDFHPDGDDFSASEALVSQPDNGSVSLSANGSFTYTPDQDFDGTDTFEYQISDGDQSSTGTVTIDVQPVNDPPVANNDEFETPESAPLEITDAANGVLGNDTDVDGDELTASVVDGEGVDNGTLTLNEDGTFTYSPDGAFDDLGPEETAEETFTYEASDGSLADQATVTVTINGENTAPVASDDEFETPESAPLEITDAANGVLGNDTDVDGDELTASVVDGEGVDNGTLTLNEDGTFTYSPDGAFDDLGPEETAEETFTYEASDGSLADQATVTVTINGENTAPVASDDEFETPESAPLEITDAANGVLGNDTDVDGDELTASVVDGEGVDNGTLTLNEDGTFTYSPDGAFDDLGPEETAEETFTYEASDGSLADQATVTVTINGENTAPTISGLPETETIDEDEEATVSFSVDDAETAPENLSVRSNSDNTNLVPNDSIDVTGPDTEGASSLTIEPTADSNGTAPITVTVENGGEETTSQTFSLEVNPVPDAPVAVNDTFSVDQGGELTRSGADGLLANDFDPDGDSFEATTFPLESPANGDASISANGSFRYAPEEGFSGTDQFTYRIEDNTGLADTATVTVNVETVDVTISGTVSYPGEGDSGLTDGRPLGGVPVDVSTLSGDVAARDTTGSDGTFSVTVQSGEYVVEGRPEATLDVPSEINATDASRTVQAFLGNDPFAGDFQQEVADVNESGSINATDALKMALFFGNPGETTFEAGEWAATSRTVDVTGGTDTDVSVLAAAYGDANLSGGEESAGGTVAARSNATDGSAVASAAEASGESDLRSVGTEKTFEVPVRLDRGAEISSYSLQVGFPAETVSFEGVSGTERDVIASAENGTVRLSWFDRSGESPMQLGSGSSVVTLRFRADASAEKGAVFSPEITAGELAGPSAEPLQGASLAAESVKIGSVLPEEFALKGNYPNPISSGQATIEMDLPSKASVTVEVYNTLGQKVQTVERSMAAGTGQTVRVDGSRLASGQYFYRVRADLGDSTTEETGQITVVR